MIVRRRACLLIAPVLCAFLAFAAPARAGELGYAIWFSGQVLTVDRHRGTLRVAHGPTETAGAGVEECLLTRRALKHLRPGMEIEAQADTRHRPWSILHLRIFEPIVTPQTHLTA